MDDRKIIVSTGWEADQLGNLTQVVMPSYIETLQAPEFLSYQGKYIYWLPSIASRLRALDAPNCVQIPQTCCLGFTNLTQVNLPALTSLSSSGNGGSSGAFYGCTGLTTISLPALTSLSSSSNNNGSSGAFYGCTGLTTISLPALTSLSSSSNSGYSGAFYGCTGLTTISLPALVTNNDTGQYTATFCNCRNLTDVQLGSEGHAVTSLGQYMFKGCTQSNLTITVYTNGGASIANAPWGATNATVIYEEA